MGWTAEVPLPAGARDFYLLDSVQTSSGAHAASYTMSTGGSFPGVKRSGLEAYLDSPVHLDELVLN
jgi:hypothetical protein